jgi:virulence factor Mce-like protein
MLEKVRIVVLDHPWALILSALVILFGIWLYESRQNAHVVKAQFASAELLDTGMPVKVRGVQVGRVDSVRYDPTVRGALVGVGIDNDKVWPLHQGTRLIIQWGTTIGAGDRDIELIPGPVSAPTIPGGATIGMDETQSPVEFDQIFNTLDPTTRAHLQEMLSVTGSAVGTRANALNKGLGSAPGTFSSLAGVLADLGEDQQALSGVLTNGSAAMGVLAAHQPDIENVIAEGAMTFDAFAKNTIGTQASIAGLPQTFSQVQVTLARLRGSIGGLDRLMNALRPGAAMLPQFADLATPALSALHSAAPRAAATFATLTRHGGVISSFLGDATPFTATAGVDSTRGAPMLACIRPYSPEIAGFFGDWAGYSQPFDATSHYARVHGLAGPSSWGDTPMTSQQFTSAVPGTGYAMPRPPGLNAGHPILLPQCGITPNALNAADDPEARP